MFQNRQIKKLLTGIMAFVLILAMAAPLTTQAATTPKSIASKVKTAVGKSNYPFSSSDKVESSRKVFSVDPSTMSSYVAYEKTTSDAEYLLFIGKASSKSDAKTAKSKLKSYIKETTSSMNSYLSKAGKTNLKKAEVGYSGQWVWAVVLKSSVDKKAVKAIKNAIK